MEELVGSTEVGPHDEGDRDPQGDADCRRRDFLKEPLAEEEPEAWPREIGGDEGTETDGPRVTGDAGAAGRSSDGDEGTEWDVGRIRVAAVGAKPCGVAWGRASAGCRRCLDRDSWSSQRPARLSAITDLLASRLIGLPSWLTARLKSAVERACAPGVVRRSRCFIDTLGDGA